MTLPTVSSAPSSPTSSFASTPSRSQDNQPVGFPDYSLWTSERWARYPGLLNGHDSKAERKWWWKHGYRLKDPKGPHQGWPVEAAALL
ncbi:uncharacterized protein BCR38DRAFT_445889 [Pseudomassariella vexata]|uniref:Uncharacterized protein n=1 Tax=Pseudomassariella vexata TaxID=1141098 RepID=A0A1Y2DIY8_9PEZI|nr:uncharacterized protein BCR38DRAFT_445889 [Pseudomassariella vexata]ORY59193.1 hypothetical protein BCR38DRAFT_445889 [Pseudomassariella vexata]